MAARLREVTAHYVGQGITLLPVKGIVLGSQLYARPADRPSADVDLLVRPDQFLPAVAVARRNKWPIVWDSRQLGNANFIVDGVCFDLAASIGPPGTSAVGVAAFMSRAVIGTDPLGFPRLEPDWHDHLLLMCIDAFKDKLGSKPWADQDLLRMVTRPVFNTERFLRLAHDARLVTLVAIVAGWLDVHSSPGWNNIRRGLRTRGYRRNYAKLFDFLLNHADRGQRSVALGVITRAVSDSSSRQAWALLLGGVGAAVFHGRRAGLWGRLDKLE